MQLATFPLSNIGISISAPVLPMALHHSALDLANVTVAVWVAYLAVAVGLIVEPLTGVLA